MMTKQGVVYQDKGALPLHFVKSKCVSAKLISRIIARAFVLAHSAYKIVKNKYLILLKTVKTRPFSALIGPQPSFIIYDPADFSHKANHDVR
jgi:hypothetical protein